MANVFADARSAIPDAGVVPCIRLSRTEAGAVSRSTLFGDTTSVAGRYDAVSRRVFPR